MKMPINIPEEMIRKLRESVARIKGDRTLNEMEDSRKTVLSQFQPVFSPDNVKVITEEEFRSFLPFKNNRHWTGLARLGPRMCADMARLREALVALVDESQGVADRLDLATGMVSGMGKNVASAILLITQPDRYGVWNRRSEAALKRFEIWPDFDRRESFGSRYVKVNQRLLELRDALQVDLWTLDALLWRLDELEADDRSPAESVEMEPDDAAIENEQGFGLERHLHEFLRDNWSQIELGREWAIYSEPGDEEAGYEYPCAVGRIDILAKHRREPSWLVIELKRNQTSDQTVGQLLRYMGWVKQHMAENVEQVHGMIICRKGDEGLHYALSNIQNVALRFYQVQFSLKKSANQQSDLVTSPG